MSEQLVTHITATPIANMPHMNTIILSDQWLRLLNELQQLRKDDCEAAVILLSDLKVGSVIAFEKMRL